MSIQQIIYRNPIQEDIPRREFQDCARERMNIYRCLDPYKDRFDEKAIEAIKITPDFNQENRNFLMQLYNPWASSLSKIHRKRDNISHYICRLMFCMTPQNKDSFISYETMIFKSRLFEKMRKNVKEQEIFELLTSLTTSESFNVGEICQVDEEEFMHFKAEIYASTDFYSRFPKESPMAARKYELWSPRSMYKVPMEFCEYLVSRRECFIHGGFAYLQGDLLIRTLPRIYSKYLRMVLDDLEKSAYDILAEDEQNQFREFIRTEPMTMFNHTVNAEELKEGLNLKNIMALSKRSFPPCMIQMYDTLVTKKHLKHEARLQLMLFLKVAGLSLQDSQHLWKANYTKGVNDSQMKQVQYTVRHSYGQEGKKVDYSSKDCAKIIASKPTTGEYHGCPFKYYGDPELAKFLKSKYPNVDQTALNEIMEKKSKNEFEIACRTLFEKTHPDPNGKHLNFSKGVGRQPNSYYYQSEKYFETFDKK